MSIELDNTAFFEKVREVDPSIKDVENMPPICKLWEWFLDKDRRIYAMRWQDHPTLGSGPGNGYKWIHTGAILWINYDIGMARSANTLYRLMEAPSR